MISRITARDRFGNNIHCRKDFLICAASFIFLFCLLFTVPLFSEQLNHYPLDTLYHLPEEILTSLWERVEMRPDLASWMVIGHSSNEKLPIYALRITNQNSGLIESKPSILLHGQHHSEEPIGVEIVFYMSHYFLTHYEEDSFVKYLVDNYNLWFVPTINPEGFRITNRGIYRLKRKNNTDTNMNGIFEITKDGVDLNRNYPFNWDKDELDDPESPYFKGFEAASQSEIGAMIEFYDKHSFQLTIFYHSSASGSYSERIFFPWRWGNVFSPDYEEILHLADTIAGHLPRTYADGNYSVNRFNTSQRGFARDYIYSEHGTLAMLIETGGNSPYGEGVINPPNEVLIKIKEKHTEALLQLLKEYDKNLMSGRVVDFKGKPLADKEIIIEGKQSEYKNNPLTNGEGYFFYFLLPSEQPYVFYIEEQEFIIPKEEDKRQELEFRIAGEGKAPFIVNPLNEGKALVLANPVFQYYPPLVVNKERKEEIGKLYLTVRDGAAILHREQIPQRGDEFLIPWIPTNLNSTVLLDFQHRDIHPLTDEEALRNKVIFLQDKREILTYAGSYSRYDSWYLQPEMKIGIDYTLYPAGENDYLIEGVSVLGNEQFRSDNLKLILYAGAEKFYVTRESVSEGERVLFRVPDLSFPNDLFLVVANHGYQPHSILNESGFWQQVRAGRTYVYHSQWEPFAGKDLAIEVHLRKRE